MAATTKTLSFKSAKVYDINRGNKNSNKEKYSILKTLIRSKHPRDYWLIDGRVGSAKTYT